MCDFEKVIYHPELQISLAKWGHSVNESGGWLLAAQRSIKRQVRGKESLLYFKGCNREWGVGGQTPIQMLTSPTFTDNQRARAFIDGGRGLHAKTVQLAPSS